MSTSFVDFGGETGFWINDGILELWLRFLALHLEEPDPGVSDHPVYAIRNRWMLASKIHFGGCSPLSLATDCADPVGKAAVIAAIHALMDELRRDPGDLDARTLNLLGLEGGHSVGGFPSANLLEVGDAFLRLIAGEITTTAGDPALMPGNIRS